MNLENGNIYRNPETGRRRAIKYGVGADGSRTMRAVRPRKAKPTVVPKVETAVPKAEPADPRAEPEPVPIPSGNVPEVAS